MSTVVSLSVLDRDQVKALAELVEFGPFMQVLAEHGRPVQPGCEWSGDCMLALLDYLEDRGVRLRHSDLEAESSAINEVYDDTLLLTPAHQKYLSELAPDAHDEDELRAWFAEEDLEFEEVGMAGKDGLELLRDQLSALQPDEVLLLNVG